MKQGHSDGGEHVASLDALDQEGKPEEREAVMTETRQVLHLLSQPHRLATETRMNPQETLAKKL